MGLMRFRLPVERITDDLVQQAYLSGIDRTAWQVRATVENDLLIMQRAESDSANLHIPWPLEGFGPMTYSTGSLMEREKPYLLPLEIVRGTIGQINEQLFDWKSIGLQVPDKLTDLISEAMKKFSAAAMCQDEPVATLESAEKALRLATEASNRLAVVYSEQALTVRRRNEGKISALLGADLGQKKLDNHTARHFLLAFDAANVPIQWRKVEAIEGQYDWSISDKQIKWCKLHRLHVGMGPLLHFDTTTLPDWLALWEGDFDNLISFFSEHIRMVVERYRGKVDMWQCAGRVNTGDILSLSEEEKIRLTARTIEIVRQYDPQTPIIVSFDQPWAEYMSRRSVDFPPLHFADALIRSDLGLSGVMLEINAGYYPGGTLPRNPLEFSRQLDIWSSWGLPLWISVCAPSSCDADPMARKDVKLPRGSWTLAAQQAWVARYLPLMLAKSYVKGVLWNQLHDGRQHDFPYGGLFDFRRHAKPALRTLASLRRMILK